MATGAAKCKNDKCNNLTFNVYCHLHDGRDAVSSTLSNVRIASLPKSNNGSVVGGTSYVEVENPTKIWADTKRVFIDIQDQISPDGIRDQVRSYAEGAATTISLRFAKDERLEIDAALRDKKIEELTGSTVDSLVPSSAITEQEDAEFIANAIPQDGLGGFSDSDDAKAVIAYGIRKEWELAQSTNTKESSDNIPYDIPYENFLSVVYNNDIAPHVVTAMRREASDFHANVIIATGSKAANPAPVNPKGALPPRAESEPIHSSYFDEAREWVKARNEQKEAYERAQLEEAAESAERIRQQQEAISAVINAGVGAISGIGRIYKNTNEWANKLFKVRPEDYEQMRRNERQYHKDVFFERATRKARQRHKLF